MRSTRRFVLAGMAIFVATGASAQSRTSPYDPYAFLIGDWDISPSGGSPVAVDRIGWGTGRSYMTMQVSLFTPAGLEPHFEGVLMWNGRDRRLDMLVMLDLRPNAGAQEQGYLASEAEGRAIREITAIYSPGAPLPGGGVAGPEGATAHFRQTFVADGPDRILTTLTRETPAGWVSTFPGSEALVMTRRPA